MARCLGGPLSRWPAVSGDFDHTLNFQTVIADLHEGDAAAVSGKQHKEWCQRGVYTSGCLA